MAQDPVQSKSYTNRKAGILVHPTSFPGPYGIGDLGPAAYQFIDFLKKAGQKVWQVLPIGPTGYGDSPYQAFSSYAGQPLFISPVLLDQAGLLDSYDLADTPDWDPGRVDYGSVINYKVALFKKAWSNFKSRNLTDLKSSYDRFCEEQKHWLDDYALFMAVKDAHDGVVWTRWDEAIAFPTEESKKAWATRLSDEIGYYKFIQMLFYDQWLSLKRYANENNIVIVGDTPIFVAFDSADVWGNKELFYLDSKGHPTIVAGVPPDYFSATGQLWGNPLYDWDKHKETGYSWWIEKVRHTLKLVDTLRIDHFRGFEAYWAVPAGADTAINGEWLPGPFKDLFYAFENTLGKNLPIIAEDLGVITPEVEDLRDSFNLPGMKILQFGFETLKENDFLPHHYTKNSICYTGTHDNDTTLGWYQSAGEASKDKVRRYMNTDAKDVVWDFIRICFGSVSDTAVIPMQDLFSLDSASRMNTPGVAAGNWQWRYTTDMLSDSLAARLKAVTKLYGR